MSTEKFYTMSEVDELLLEVLATEPEKDVPIQGIIQIVHGKSEHKERYLAFMQYMSNAGYACIIHDLRGHGKSVRNESDLGYMYQAGEEGFLQDIHQITGIAGKRWPGLPIILFGHGLGSLAVRCFAKRWEEDISCMIVCGSPSRNPAALPGLLFAKARNIRKGSASSSKILKNLTLAPYDKRFPGEKAEFNWLCRNQEAVREYNEDPLCGFDLKTDGYEVYLQLLEDTYRKTGWKTAKPDMPILFIGGADDPYIGGPAIFHQSLKSMRSHGYRNVRGKLYTGLRHEILNEEEQDHVFRDLEKYLNQVLARETDLTEE